MASADHEPAAGTVGHRGALPLPLHGQQCPAHLAPAFCTLCLRLAPRVLPSRAALTSVPSRPVSWEKSVHGDWLPWKYTLLQATRPEQLPREAAAASGRQGLGSAHKAPCNAGGRGAPGAVPELS